jgi:RNA polymerase sigma-70 factor (ECF subfamily)
MPLQPSKHLHFESYNSLLQWLPEATESQLMTVFVWANNPQAPPGDARRLAQVRTEAFEVLVARTHDRLVRFLLQRCGCQDPDLAEDVVQQVLIKLYLRAEQYDPRRSFWGWLYRIARNDLIDTLRRIRPGDRGIGQTTRPSEDAEGGWEDQVLVTTTPENVAVDKEQAERLEEAISALPNLQRTIVRLKRQGIKGKDIARQLGVSQAHVSQLYHEAGEVLREAIEG